MQSVVLLLHLHEPLVPLVGLDLNPFPLVVKNEGLLHHLRGVIVDVLLGDLLLDLVYLDFLKELGHMSLLVVGLGLLYLGFVPNALQVLAVFNDFLG